MVHQIVRSTARLLRVSPRNTVFLEGGLGSQIMGLMLYQLRKVDNPATVCDVTYFFPEIQVPQITEGATRWPWELHRYGFDLRDPEFVRSPRYRLRVDYSTQAVADECYAGGLTSRRWSDLFPIVPRALSRANELGAAEVDGYACVHVRRGDYLKVGSRVVNLSEVLDLIGNTTVLLPQRIVFLSDAEFTPSEVALIKSVLPDKDLIFLSEDDQHVAHGILRMSRTLVTSNSTFSWTAALLMERQDALAIAPQHFFGATGSPLNHVFQAPSSWMLITPTR